jgi:hypothetical protein
MPCQETPLNTASEIEFANSVAQKLLRADITARALCSLYKHFGEDVINPIVGRECELWWITHSAEDMLRKAKSK